MKLSRPQPQEPAKQAQAPAVDLGAQKAAHALPEAFKAQAQAPSVDGLRSFASGSAAVRDYNQQAFDLCGCYPVLEERDAEVIGAAILSAVRDPRMVAIRDAIRDREQDPEWDWTKGGCHFFAPALQEALDGRGEIVGVCQFEEPPGTSGCDCWVNQHSLLHVDGFLFDGEGLQAEEKVLTEYRMVGPAWGPRPSRIASRDEMDEVYQEVGEDYFFPTDEFVPEVACEVLRKCLQLNS